MRGTTVLRPARLVLAGRPASRSACLSCRYSHSTSGPSVPRGMYSHQQRQLRYFSSSSPHTYPSSAAEETSPIAPDVTNHYTLFPTTLPQGPPPRSPFDIDVGALRREFLQLQGAIHPDKFPAGPNKQRAEALSSRINDAYRTLIDPLSRAQYLLSEFHGIDVLAEDGASRYWNALSPETLMEIMDVQETVEELSSAPAAEAEATVDRLRAENAERVQSSLQALSGAFDAGDIETAQMETVRLRFWYSLRDGLREWEPGHEAIRIVH